MRLAATDGMAILRSRDEVLLQGPHARRHELSLLLRTVGDFLRGFRALHFVGPCVTVFGSARFGEEHAYYASARALGRGIARLGFTVMTGGGPGLMEAANRGAKEAGGRSVGCNIKLPREQEPNRFLDRWVTCHHFFVRKVLLFKYSYAFVALPGGIGTLDEVFEALTLVQTHKIAQFPIVLVGLAYWTPLMDLLHRLIAEGAMEESDLDLLFATDSVDDALEYLRRNAIDRFALRPPKPSRWLGELSVLQNAFRPPSALSRAIARSTALSTREKLTALRRCAALSARAEFRSGPAFSPRRRFGAAGR